MTPEQKVYYDRELASVRRGGYSHDAWVHDHIYGIGSANLGPVDPPVVGMANDSDGHYTQYFQNREELETFITQLRETADKAWGPVPLKWTDKMTFDIPHELKIRDLTAALAERDAVLRQALEALESQKAYIEANEPGLVTDVPAIAAIKELLK